VSLTRIVWMFFRAGLAFGGGPAIRAVLENEVVSRRRIVSAFL